MVTGMMKLCGTNGKVDTYKMKQHYPEGKDHNYSSIKTGGLYNVQLHPKSCFYRRIDSY